MATSTDNIVIRMELIGARDVVRESKSASRAVGGVGTAAHSSSKKATTAGQRMKSSFASAGKSALKFGLATVGITSAGLALRKVGEETIGFDAAMRNVNSIAQLSEGRFQALSERVLDLAGPTAQSPQTLAAGLYDLVSSGFNANQAIRVLASSAKAATAGLTDTATSTKAIAAVLNAYHLQAKDAASVSDSLFQTVNLGVGSFEELASTIGKTLPLANAFGVSIDEVGPALATLTKQGFSFAEANTAVRSTLVGLAKPTEGMKDAIEELGFKNADALVSAKGYEGALKALVGTTDGTKAGVAALFENQRALIGAFGLTGKNAKAAGEDIAGFGKKAGATDRALRQQSKSISYQWNKLKAEASALAIRVGFAFIKMVRDISEAKGKVGRVINVLARFLGPYITNVVGGMVSFIRHGLNAVGVAFQLIADVITLKWGKAWRDLKQLVSEVLQGILGGLRAFLAPFIAMGKLLGDGFIKAIADAINWGIERINDAMDKANVLGKLGVDAPNLPTIDVGGSPVGTAIAGGGGVRRHHHQGGGGGVVSGPGVSKKPISLSGLVPRVASAGSASEPFVIMLDGRPIFEGMARRAGAEAARA